MSRCECTAALGLPVVPEVKASRAMSSAAVGQAAKLPSFCAERTASEPGALGALKTTTSPETRKKTKSGAANLFCTA